MGDNFDTPFVLRLSKPVLSTAEGHERASGPVTAVFRFMWYVKTVPRQNRHWPRIEDPENAMDGRLFLLGMEDSFTMSCIFEDRAWNEWPPENSS